MKVKLECPTNFLSASELEDILVKYQSSLYGKVWSVLVGDSMSEWQGEASRSVALHGLVIV